MNIEEAIQTAIEYEQRVVQVYEESALSSADPAGRKIFGVLVKEERSHVAYLLTKLEEWKSTGRVTAASLGTVVPSSERIEAGVRALQGRVAVKSPEAEMRLLKRALDVELETGAFYTRVVNELPPEGRRLFEPFLDIPENDLEG
jgi:rubrerythrin